jgi:hypothetical protein
MIYCGSRFWFQFLLYFGKVLVPVPFPVPVPDPDLISKVFQQQKFVQNLAYSVIEAALFPRKLSSVFLLETALFPRKLSSNL